jgi:transposase InsO family protein
MRTELVTDALGRGHSGNGFVRPGLLASMGTVGDCYDNAMMESF